MITRAGRGDRRAYGVPVPNPRSFWVCLVLVAAVVCGCGSQPGGATAPPAPRTPPVSPSAPAAGRTAPGVETTTSVTEQAAVEAVFHGYYGALLARDFVTACALLAPEAVDRLRDRLAAQGTPAEGCEMALDIVLARPEAAAHTDEVARTARVHDIRIRGDEALITWSAVAGGQTTTATGSLRRIDDLWRLVETR